MKEKWRNRFLSAMSFMFVAVLCMAPMSTAAGALAGKARAAGPPAAVGYDANEAALLSRALSGVPGTAFDPSRVPENRGVWVAEDSRETLLRLLNQLGGGRYFCTADGYLSVEDSGCLKQGAERSYREKLEALIHSDKTILVAVDEGYDAYSEAGAAPYSIHFEKGEYASLFSCGQALDVLLLNSRYYGGGARGAVSDSILLHKLLEVYHPDEPFAGGGGFSVSPASAANVQAGGVPLAAAGQADSLDRVKARMNAAKTVYAGPSGSNYAAMGSVSNGEDVVVLGRETDWYFISYAVTGSTAYKSGWVPVSAVSGITGTVHSLVFSGGAYYATATLDVRSTYPFEASVSSGTVGTGEGFTLLSSYTENGKSFALIEYSTPSGTKRGFIPQANYSAVEQDSLVARVKPASSPIYAGPDAGFARLGSVNANEYVAVLQKEDSWAFVEYNTAGGRKRGYLRYADLEPCFSRSLEGFASRQSMKKATADLTVYGGPHGTYASIGTVFKQEVVSYLGAERSFAYVEYTTADGAKRGYVKASALTDASLPELPALTVYQGFTSGAYGTSGLGQPLRWFRIGAGPNVMVAVFEQHGWEDAWASDGVELIKIADAVMAGLSRSGQNFEDWSIYIIPYANPDGVTNGYSNNGPGRCTVAGKVDMNRCWPANFTPNYTSRNYTGDAPLQAVEAVALKEFISSKLSAAGENNEKIVLDIHGWLNQTYGSSEIGAYFGRQFGFPHSSTYGSGYLETWAMQQGAKSCLVELPMPSSSADIVNRDYAGRLTAAMLDMVTSMGNTPGGGTAVNEACVITTNTSVNVRSGPGTSYSILTSLTNGTAVTRVARAVLTANGFVWDKIKLSDGTTGYVATDYLKLQAGEPCVIVTNSSVNVRSGPGTSYSVLTALANGTAVTRLAKSVAAADGYVWDRILLKNGEIGYVVTDYVRAGTAP